MQDAPPENFEVLDRAAASLRDSIVPPLPLVMAQTTIGVLRAADRTRARARWLLRVAAVLFLTAVTAAVLIVALRREAREITRQSSPNRPAQAPQVGPPPPSSRQAPPVPEPPSPVVVVSGVSVAGRVFFHGTPPVARAVDLSACPPCAALADGRLSDESVTVNPDGTLQNVVISISAGLPSGEQFVPPAAPVMLDQKGCRFQPHVIAAMVGQPIVVKNSDPLLHSVHSLDAEQSPAFNFAQPTAGQRVLEPLQIVETFQVRCDLHPWMNAWVRVFNHPYFAVTQADGSFSLKQLPPGEYRLKAWHESLGVIEKRITVTDTQPARVDFTFEAK